jgi:hypothetical protein
MGGLMFRKLAMMAVGLALVSTVPTVCCGQSIDDLTLPKLERQLNALLRTRLDVEKAYLASVVELVERGELPRRLINISLKYVLNKKSDSPYRFIYFVRVLGFLAAREKIEIPKFDFEVYSKRR